MSAASSSMVGGTMKRSIHNRSVVLALLLIAMLSVAVMPAAAQEGGDPGESASVTQSAETPEANGDDASDVTELPTTGRGHGQDATATASEKLAIHQMLTTILVLVAAALGGIAILWSYERR